MLSQTDRSAMLTCAAELERQAKVLRTIAGPPPALEMPSPMRGVRLRAAAAIVAAVLILASAAAAASRPEAEAIAAHRSVDYVLRVKFGAAWNEWTLKHPQDTYDAQRQEIRTGEHMQRLDKADAERWSAVIEAWDNLRAGMRKAGYR